jgi:zinc D-Ala-D-Ala carboxypeptidase
MKKQAVFLPTAFGLVLAGLVFQFAFGKRDAFAQVSSGDRTLVSRTVSSAPAERPREVETALSRFSAAASLNARSRRTMTWAFGAKQQTGWDIYVPLVSQTIGTNASPDFPEFASSLSKWQSKNSLEPTGILDDTTMRAMAKYWQSQRLGRSDVPSADRLLTAPIIDFFDPTRSPDLLQLERETYTAYKKMLQAASKDLKGVVRFTKDGELAEGEKFFRIVSAFRSPDYQATLRAASPGSGRVALAKHSAHATGQALDIYVGGEPVTTKDANRLIQVNTPAYKWLVKNASRFGFYPYFYEPWHWEYVPGPIGQR